MTEVTTMKSPRGKAELLTRLMSFDFGGNWKGLGADVQITRVKPHIATLLFPDVGRKFELVIRIPRGERPKKAKTKAPATVAAGKLPANAGKGRNKQPAQAHH